MSFRINSEGEISVVKDSKLVMQFCPYRENTRCGLWCPKVSVEINSFGAIRTRTLRTCSSEIYQATENHIGDY